MMDDLPRCPNCGYQAKSDQDPLITAYNGMGECPACGIVVAKYHQAQDCPAKRFEVHRVSTTKWTLVKWGAALFGLALAAIIYWKFPPMALVAPGDPGFGAHAESAGGNLSNYTAYAKGKFIRIHSHSARWHWRAKTARQPRVFSLSKTGQYLATAALPRVIRIWEKGLLWYSPLYEFHGSIDTPTAMTFNFDGTCVAMIGDNDEKLELHDMAQQKVVLEKDLETQQLPSFRLRISRDSDAGAYDIALSGARLVYVQGDGLYGSDFWKLQDQVSGQFIKTYNDGWKARYEPAKTLSWHLNGRYTAYAEKDGIYIWKLCDNRTCRFGREK